MLSCALILLLSSFGVIYAQDTRLRVIATTTIVADVARNVGGEWVEVTAVVPVESDSHAYQPTPTDAVLLDEADVVLVNGMGLEAFLGDLVENAAGVELTNVSLGIEVLALGNDGRATLGILGEDIHCAADQNIDVGHDHIETNCDPHVWMNPENVKQWSENIAEAFILADIAHADEYRQNLAAYFGELDRLDDEIRMSLADIPIEKRRLLTNHDFMAYYAAAYDFDIVGVVIPDGSTASEPTPQELAALIDFVNATDVPAIFAETTANSRLAEVVAAASGIEVITTLYSESLSAADGPAATYLDLLRYNTAAIVQAFGGGE